MDNETNQNNDQLVGEEGKMPPLSASIEEILADAKVFLRVAIGKLEKEKDQFAKSVMIRDLIQADIHSDQIMAILEELNEYLSYSPDQKDFRGKAPVRIRVTNLKKHIVNLYDHIRNVNIEEFIKNVEFSEDRIKEIIWILSYYETYGIKAKLSLTQTEHKRQKEKKKRNENLKSKLNDWQSWVEKKKQEPDSIELQIKKEKLGDIIKKVPISGFEYYNIDNYKNKKFEANQDHENAISPTGGYNDRANIPNEDDLNEDQKLKIINIGIGDAEENDGITDDENAISPTGEYQPNHDHKTDDNREGIESRDLLNQYNGKPLSREDRDNDYDKEGQEYDDTNSQDVGGSGGGQGFTKEYKGLGVEREGSHLPSYQGNFEKGVSCQEDFGQEDLPDQLKSDHINLHQDNSQPSSQQPNNKGQSKSGIPFSIQYEQKPVVKKKVLPDVIRSDQMKGVANGRGKDERSDQNISQVQSNVFHQRGSSGIDDSVLHNGSEDESELESGSEESRIINLLIAEKLNDDGSPKYHVSEDVNFATDGLSVSRGPVNYQDVIKPDPYMSPDIMEQKGRINPPVDIRMYPDLWMGDGRRVLGVDVARKGDDKTVLAMRFGMHVVDIQTFAKLTVPDSAGRVIAAIGEWEPDEVVIDITGGLGAGVYDLLKKSGIGEILKITAVAFNELPRNDKIHALNKRAEMYLMLQEKLSKGEISLPSDEELLEELVQVKYEFTMSGDGDKMKIVPKEKTKKDLGRSPDKADAVCLAFYSRAAFKIF